MDKNHEANRKAHEEDSHEYHPHEDHYKTLVHFGEDRHTLSFKAFEQTPWLNHDSYEHVVTGAECAADFGTTAGGNIILKNFDNKQTVYKKELDGVKMAKWMSYHSVPHFSHMNEDLSHSLFDETRGRHIMVLLTEDTKKDEHVIKAFKNGADNFNHGDLVFVQSGISNKHDHMGSLLGVTEVSSLPQVWVVTPTSYGSIKYPLSNLAGNIDPHQLTAENVVHFANEF